MDKKSKHELAAEIAELRKEVAELKALILSLPRYPVVIPRAPQPEPRQPWDSPIRWTSQPTIAVPHRRPGEFVCGTIEPATGFTINGDPAEVRFDTAPGDEEPSLRVVSG
jgi:hypothetical protein